MEQIGKQINEVLAALADPKLKLTDAQIAMIGQLSAAWGALQTPINTRNDAYAHPVEWMPDVPAWSAPMGAPPPTTQKAAPRTNTTNYYGPVGPQVQMPVYTNNSPGAIQDSMAIATAAML